MKDSHADEVTSNPLAGLVKRAPSRAPTSEQDDAAVQRLILAQRRSIARSARTRWLVASSLAAALFGLVLFVALRPAPVHGPTPLTLTESPLPGQVSSSAQRRYAFSDGTSLSLQAGSALELFTIEPVRPRVRLLNGEANVRVVHRAGTTWTFLAGPFEVEVTGTTFGLAWSPATQIFALNLAEGHVNVRGPVVKAPLHVEPGQRVWISVGAGTLKVSRRDDAQAPAESSSSPAPRSNAEPAPISPATAPSATPTSWRVLVARGKFEQVVAEATARPLSSCLAQCNSQDLRALADAARYSNRLPLATQALLSLRKRFSGSAEHAVAAFLLGRTYEAARASNEARVWYARYLAEAPSGEFAVDAAAGAARLTETR